MTSSRPTLAKRRNFNVDDLGGFIVNEGNELSFAEEEKEDFNPMEYENDINKPQVENSKTRIISTAVSYDAHQQQFTSSNILRRRRRPHQVDDLGGFIVKQANERSFEDEENEDYNPTEETDYQAS